MISSSVRKWIAGLAIVVGGSLASAPTAAAEPWPYDYSRIDNQYGYISAWIEFSSHPTNPALWRVTIRGYSESLFQPVACQVFVTVKYNGESPLRRVLPCDAAGFSSGRWYMRTPREWTLTRPPRGTLVEGATRTDQTLNGYRYSSNNAAVSHRTATR